MTVPRADGIRAAADPDAILRMALEASLDAASAARGLIAAVDLGTGELFAVLGIGLGDARLDRQRPVALGGPRHPFLGSLRHGELSEFEPKVLARPPLARVRRLGLRSATVVPLAAEVTLSPCLAAGRCLSARTCLVGERTASASPDEEWRRRVAGSCVRATVLRAPAAVVVDAYGLAEPIRQRLAELGEAAGAAPARFPPLPAVAAATPTGESEEEWQRRAFAAVDDPVLVADAQANVLFANAPARQLFTASSSEGDGRRRAVDFNRMLLSAWLTSYLRVPEAERPRELALVDPVDGSELLFELLGTTAYNSVARETGTVVVLKDVSDLRHAGEEVEASLRRSIASAEAARREGEQLRLVIENIDQPIVVADPRSEGGEGVLASGKIDVLQMNDAARRLLQPEPDATERRRQVVKRNDAIVTSFLSQVSIGERETSTELAVTDPLTEETRSFAADAAIARDRLGAAVAIVCVLSDLTELRELERRRVERQLFESEKLAATGRLAASFAHEINNPLESMKNALYLLGTSLPAEHADRRYVDIARSETERISRIVRQILGFYRPSVVRASMNVNTVLTEVTELLTPQMRKSRVICELRLDDAIPRIVASSDQLRQVFLNLLLNSTQAMTQGGRIAVSTRRGQQPAGARRLFISEDLVVIEIRDDGPGISAEIREHLFEPFVTTKDPTGTGLGLWICREIVHAHGGTITADSEVGRGTAFTIVLPMAPREVAA